MFDQLFTQLSEAGIFTITINRPNAMNALNRKLLEELRMAINQVYDDSEIKAAIITGSGEKAFAAGADITELQGLDEMTARKFSENGQEIFELIENCTKPIIAAVNGFALGGGCELAMACHMRGASANARFGQPEINLGIVPGYGGTQRLTQLIGKGKSIELQLTGDMIDAQNAQKLGLVNFVEPDQDALLKACEKLLIKISQKAPIAVGMIIGCVNSYYKKDDNGYQVEANSFSRCTGTEDFKEGVSAFLEKRKANFSGN